VIQSSRRLLIKNSIRSFNGLSVPLGNDTVLKLSNLDELAAAVPVIKEQADKEDHDGSDVDGLIHEGLSYLIRENLARHTDPAANAEEALLHEFTHGDIRALYGKDIQTELNKFLP